MASPSKTDVSIKKRKPRVERFLKSIGPQLVENTKKVLIMKGNNSCETINDVLRDLGRMTKPHCVVLNHKNPIFPFEDVNSLEFLSSKNDCSLIAFGSHSKKRPNNLILGRTFDGHILDLVEFGITSFTSMDNISGPKKSIMTKSMISFLGDQWNNDSSYKKIQVLFISMSGNVFVLMPCHSTDIFRGDKTDRLSLKGLDHVVVCTAVGSKISLRTFFVRLLKSGTRIPKVELVPMGPDLDLVVRRSQFAAEDLMKLACKLPHSVKKVKVKNVKEGAMGEKLGRLHMTPQDLDKMGGRRMDALRQGKKRVAEEAAKLESSADSSGGQKRKRRRENPN